MDYSVASYFDGYHFQHIYAYQEHQRLELTRAASHAICTANERRTGSRGRFR